MHTYEAETQEEACNATGENADFWYKFKPGMNDRQKGGLVLFSLLRGLSQTMRGCRRAGVSCDIHPHSILALIGESRGIAVGPVVYAPNTCRPARAPVTSLTSQFGTGVALR